MGFSPREKRASPFTANSDIPFWERLAIQGNYDGFRLIDIAEPDNQVQLLVYRDCAGNQGDVLVWDNLVIRSWNSPAPAGATCDGQVVELGFEGPHVFDICDRMDPQLLASVHMTAATLPIRGCGSHTATLVPDVANGQLFVYISDVPDHHALSIRYEVTRRPCSLTSAANSGFDDVPRDRAGRWSPPKRIPD